MDRANAPMYVGCTHLNSASLLSKTRLLYDTFPTSVADEMELYYTQLKELQINIPNREVIVLIGDFNGRETGDQEHHMKMGKYGWCKRNNKGKRLLLFCLENNFYTSSTRFQYQLRMKLTKRKTRKPRRTGGTSNLLKQNNMMAIKKINDISINTQAKT